MPNVFQTNIMEMSVFFFTLSVPNTNAGPTHTRTAQPDIHIPNIYIIHMFGRLADTQNRMPLIVLKINGRISENEKKNILSVSVIDILLSVFMGLTYVSFL